MPDETKNDLPAVTEESSDSLPEVASDVLLDQTIPAPVRKALVAAFKRLGAALVEMPAGYFERRSAEKWAETVARIKITEEAGDQIRQQIKVDPEFPQRASYTFAKQILREQHNRENILGITTDILKEKQYDNPTDQQPANEIGKTITEDWFNIFEKEASQKSSEDMQTRFAKVLAGEIEKPGSHSIKAVKALGDMDQNTADLFQKLCSVCVVLKCPLTGVVIDIRVPSLSVSPGDNSLKKYELSFINLNLLNEYDLIIPDYDSRFKYDISMVRENNTATPFWHQGRYWVLQPLSEHIGGVEFYLMGVSLSNVGRELFHIVEQIPAPQYTQDLKKYFRSTGIKMIEVQI